MTKKDKWISWIMILVTFIYIAVISYITPLSSTDDLNFLMMSRKTGSTMLAEALHYGNGRLLGNLTAMLLNRYLWLRTILKPAVVVGIIVLLWKLLDIKTVTGRFFMTLMFLLMPASLMAETITWNSGFANYVPPVLGLLTCGWLVCRIDVISSSTTTSEGRRRKNIKRTIMFTALGVIGFVGQLFVEHISLVAIAMSGVLVICMKKRGRSITAPVVWLAVAVAGMCLMTFISLHFKEYAFIPGYRHVPNDVATLIEYGYINFFRFTVPLLSRMKFLGSMILTAALLVTMGNRRNVVRTIAVEIVILLSSMADGFTLAGMVVESVFIAGITVLLVMLIESVDCDTKYKLFFILLSGYVATLPLQFVRPYGLRCMMYLYMCVFAVVVTAVDRWLGRNMGRLQIKIKKGMVVSVEYTICCTMALFCVIYDSYAVRELLRLRAINIYNKSQIEQGMKENSTVITIRSDESVFFHGIIGSNLENYYYYSKAGDIQFVMEDSDEQ